MGWSSMDTREPTVPLGLYSRCGKALLLWPVEVS